MNPQDELRDLWCSHTPSEIRKGEDMLALVIERTRKFDRSITARNTREKLAGLFVAVVFGFMAWRSPSPLEAAGMAVIAVSGIWIAWYVQHFGSGPASPDRDTDLQAYERLLSDSYQRQIRLLRSVKYWYLLPPYAGYVIVLVGRILRISAQRSPRWFEFLDMVIVTLVFAAVWAANEVYGIRHLRGLQRELDAIRGREQ